MASKVAFFNVKKHGLKKSVYLAMRTAGFDKIVFNKPLFIKINAMSDQFIPGVCTNPLVLNHFLEYLRKIYPKKKVYAGDANVATLKQFDQAVKAWGYDKICKKHCVELVNLSYQKNVEVPYKGKVFKKILVPEILTKTDLITLPIMKTHCITGLTASLKNQWGCLTTVRQQYHTVAHQAIPEINDLLKPKFSLVDGTISMEGNGPRNGKLKITNVILAGRDLVAVDTAISDFMRLKKPEKLFNAQRIGLGNMKYKIVGDKFFRKKFEKPVLENHVVFKTEFFFRNLPITKWLFFKTPLFKFFSTIVSYYNKTIWWITDGKKQKEQIMNHPDFKKHYSKLLH